MKLMILTVLSAFYYHYYGLEETVIVLIIGLTLFIVFGELLKDGK